MFAIGQDAEDLEIKIGPDGKPIAYQSPPESPTSHEGRGDSLRKPISITSQPGSPQITPEPTPCPQPVRDVQESSCLDIRKNITIWQLELEYLPISLGETSDGRGITLYVPGRLEGYRKAPSSRVFHHPV